MTLAFGGRLATQILPFLPEIKSPPIKPEADFQVAGITITNSMLGSLLGFVVLLLVIRWVTARHSDRPGKLQVVVEFMIGGMYNLAKGAGGSVGDKLFPLFGALLLWILVNNWIALIPGFNHILAKNGSDSWPLFRAMNADFNSPLAMALLVVFLIHYNGVRTHGIGYFTEFVNIPALVKGRPIDFVVGIFHSIGEFAKIISLSFRLFANIYGGEIVIAVTLGLFGPIATIFYGFEAFVVAIIQAFIFGLLAVIYISLVSQHAEHPGEHGEQGSHLPTKQHLGGDAEQATALA